MSHPANDPLGSPDSGPGQNMSTMPGSLEQVSRNTSPSKGLYSSTSSSLPASALPPALVYTGSAASRMERVLFEKRQLQQKVDYQLATMCRLEEQLEFAENQVAEAQQMADEAFLEADRLRDDLAQAVDPTAAVELQECRTELTNKMSVIDAWENASKQIEQFHLLCQGFTSSLSTARRNGDLDRIISLTNGMSSLFRHKCDDMDLALQSGKHKDEGESSRRLVG